MRLCRPTPRPRAGFTLIEILIVVVILGIITSIVIAHFAGATVDAERAAFISSGRTFKDAATRYWLDNGVYLEDASSGVLPTGFDPYVLEQAWGETMVPKFVAVRAATASSSEPRQLAGTLIGLADECGGRFSAGVDRLLRWVQPVAIGVFGALLVLQVAGVFQVLYGIRQEAALW